MPRKSIKPKPKNRAYTTQHHNNMMDLAVEAVRNKTMSSYEAERAFGIPRRTILDILHNKHPRTSGAPTWLSKEEEDNIIKVLTKAADYGSPLTFLDLRIVVHRVMPRKYIKRKCKNIPKKMLKKQWKKSKS